MRSDHPLEERRRAWKALLAERGASKLELSRLAGLTYSTTVKLTTGVRDPRPDEAAKLEAALRKLDRE